MPLPRSVVAAWGLDGDVEHLEGGQGTSVRVGEVVLKPQSDEALVAWHAQICDRLSDRAFRLPAPLPSRDGRLVVDGWSATTWVEGHPVSDGDTTASPWLTVLATSRALHAALADEDRPALVDARTDRWMCADLVAWDELDPDDVGPRSRELLRGIRDLVHDEGLIPQVVHGDLSGNVLLADGWPPAVIDISPYWRPAAYADAVVVVDALLWWRTDPVLIHLGRPGAVSSAQWRSLFARALVFRLLAFDEPRRDAAEVDDQLPRYTEVLGLLAAGTDDEV
jgi:uncharacterized protein (TIGR02569 family)